jgi:hypothetical protein
MSNDVIVGFFGVLCTIIGFALSKISDIISAKLERQRNQKLLRFKLPIIKVKIDTLLRQVNQLERITDQESLIMIKEFVLENDIKEEISKLEPIADNIVTSNYNEKERDYFISLGRLKANLNYLLYLSRIHIDEPHRDEKPVLLQLLTAISKDIDYLSQIK